MGWGSGRVPPANTATTRPASPNLLNLSHSGLIYASYSSPHLVSSLVSSHFLLLLLGDSPFLFHHLPATSLNFFPFLPSLSSHLFTLYFDGLPLLLLRCLFHFWPFIFSCSISSNIASFSPFL